jgi:hypothetical protein
MIADALSGFGKTPKGKAMMTSYAETVKTQA